MKNLFFPLEFSVSQQMGREPFLDLSRLLLGPPNLWYNGLWALNCI